MLSEDDRERGMHDRMCRDFLNHGQAAPLRRLLQVKEYGEVSNVMIIYAEGFSISNYLVTRSGRQAFLGFVAMGMRGNWDQAAQQYFQVQSVEELDKAAAATRMGVTPSTMTDGCGHRPNAKSAATPAATPTR